MTTYPRALLHRRLGALLYDILAIFALEMVIAVIFLPFNGGNAIEADHPLFPLQRTLFALLPFIYFLFFWLRDAHTTGMRAWRLRIQQIDGRPITAQRAILRLLTAIISWIPLGLGFLWVFVSPTRLAWHDKLSGTEIIQLPKKEKQSNKKRA
ncbi:RDD family protein [Ignatzschineria indica]|uniref:RDD family protein n=1 Tax=Ignatzschineria indica TaxID=472583 RepID=A0A2U2AJ44_9GAMM|nr:RDD family protein [Ignatzschineria indica]PWD82673.1 RDD family protein [Ignatzschineria indica]GGZ86041.1 RDD family protein [Ignatzschineria indica]